MTDSHPVSPSPTPRVVLALSAGGAKGLAHIGVIQVLEENGIRAYLSGGEFTVAPSAFAGDIVLMVDERDIQRATALHEAYFGEGSESPDSPGGEAPTEPSA